MTDVPYRHNIERAAIQTTRWGSLRLAPIMLKGLRINFTTLDNLEARLISPQVVKIVYAMPL